MVFRGRRTQGPTTGQPGPPGPGRVKLPTHAGAAAPTSAGPGLQKATWAALGTGAAGTGRRRGGTVAVTDDAIEKVKTMILSGRLRPGERLPRESELAAGLGLSRNSLREAVRALTLVNILDVRQGDGTYVTSLDPPLLLEPLGFAAEVPRDGRPQEVLAVRRILEPAAAAMAAERIGEEELAVLRDLVDDLSGGLRARSDVSTLMANDLEFHRRIGEAAGNSMLSALMDAMAGPAARARVWRILVGENAAAHAVAEHRAILDALADGDAEAARSRAAAHVAGMEQWLAKAL